MHLSGPSRFLVSGCIWLAALLLSLSSYSLIADPNAEDAELGIHQVGYWEAPSDSRLIIRNHQHRAYQATLTNPCPGLASAKAIAFSNNNRTSLNRFSSVILPDGTRCPFSSFTLLP